MTDSMPVIYVVDDDPSVLKSLERLLRSPEYEVRTFQSALEFLHFQHPDAPGCLILDVEMPDLNGLELQEQLANRGISLPIIFITGHGTVPMSVRAMKAGADDFLQKPFNSADLLSAVSRSIGKDRLARQDREEVNRLRKLMNTLTSRELEVFKLVVTGMLNKQIAYELGTTEKTIKVHRARVFCKMEARSLVELARFARKLGVLVE